MGLLALLFLYGCANAGRGDAVGGLSDGYAYKDASSADGASGGSEDGLEYIEGYAGEDGRAMAAAASGDVDEGGGDGIRNGASSGEAQGSSGEAQGSSGESQGSSGRLAVYVCGAVESPGVYELPQGSRVCDAVALAGGLTDAASDTSVNQAEYVSDGQMINIPTADEAVEAAAADQAASDGLVNINTAGVEELKTLPGIGDSKAQSIIAYREANGAFQSIEDIKQIDGIKDGVFSKIEGSIKVE